MWLHLAVHHITVRRDWQEDKASTPSSSYSLADRNSSIQSTGNISSQMVSSVTENRQLHLNATRKILLESKGCVKSSIDEVTMEISRYSPYLEQTCHYTSDIIDSYLEMLNEITIAFQAAIDPYLRTPDDGINYFYRWVAPRWIAQTYRNMLCEMANYVVITSRSANSMIFANTNKG
jgi:hypothetical protein